MCAVVLLLPVPFEYPVWNGFKRDLIERKNSRGLATQPAQMWGEVCVFSGRPQVSSFGVCTARKYLVQFKFSCQHSQLISWHAQHPYFVYWILLPAEPFQRMGWCLLFLRTSSIYALLVLCLEQTDIDSVKTVYNRSEADTIETSVGTFTRAHGIIIV